jgi:hypothetical protein
MEDAEFLAAFEAATLPEDRFHHADHVRAAWLLLRRQPPAKVLTRFSRALQRYAASLQKTNLYHETITWAFVLLTNERMERGGRRLRWEEFAASNPDLLTWRPSVLSGYYTEETLQSDLARRVFLFPDRRRS